MLRDKAVGEKASLWDYIYMYTEKITQIFEIIHYSFYRYKELITDLFNELKNKNIWKE